MGWRKHGVCPSPFFSGWGHSSSVATQKQNPSGFPVFSSVKGGEQPDRITAMIESEEVLESPFKTL